MEPAKCANHANPDDNMYITEEWFRMDLLRSYVQTIDPITGATACKEYDTSFNATGEAGQVTEFSW